MSKIFQALERAERERALHGRQSGGSQPKRSSRETLQLSPVPPLSSRLDPPLSIDHTLFKNEPLKKSLMEVDSDPQPLAAAPEVSGQSVRKGLRYVDPHLISILAPETIEAERYRTICYNIEKIRREKGTSILAIVSPAIGDGKTTTAINLAGTFAQHPDIKVLLIDMDFRRPAVGKRLGIARGSQRGFVEMVAQPSLPLNEVVQQLPALSFSLLLPGNSSVLPHDVLNSSRVGEILQEARQKYDYVLLDLPPLLPAADYQSVERWADGFILVVSADKTPRKLVEEALHLVDPTKLIGLIFNNYNSSAFGYYSYYSYYDDARGANKGWVARMTEKFWLSAM